MAKPIGTIGTIPTVTVNGRVFTDVTNLKILGTYFLTDGRYSTFRALQGTTGYQVPASSAYIVGASELVTRNSTSNDVAGFTLFSSTAQTAGFDVSSEPGGAVYAFGDTGFTLGTNFFNGTNLLSKNNISALNFSATGNLYLNIKGKSSNNTTVVLYGYESATS